MPPLSGSGCCASPDLTGLVLLLLGGNITGQAGPNPPAPDPPGPQGGRGEGAVGGDFYCLGWRLYGVIFLGMG